MLKKTIGTVAAVSASLALLATAPAETRTPQSACQEATSAARGTWASIKTVRPNGTSVSARGAVDIELYLNGKARATSRNGERWGTYSVPTEVYRAATGNLRWNDNGEIEPVWICGQDMVVKGENGHATHFVKVR